MRHAGAAFVVVLGVALALVLRPPRAEAAMVCELGGSGQSCAEYPIVTHWVATTGGGFFDLAGSNADPRRLTPPSYQNYIGMITDTYAPSDQDVLNFINAIDPPPGGGTPVVLYNYDSDTALSKLVPGLNKLQVLHNVWVPVQPPRLNSLFTFIVPPGWQPTGQYPILLSGNGGWTSNNAMFFNEQSRTLATYVAQSTQAGRTGFIAVLSNAGGREALGWHRNALDDIARMLTLMQNYGVNSSKVVNFGGSRGGGTALLWGENPDHGTEYASIGVFAMAPPSHGGFISQQGLASYQGLHGVFQNEFNDPNADRYNRVPRVVDVNPAPVLNIVLNTNNPLLADREDPLDTNRKGPSGYLSRLRNLVRASPAHDTPVVLSGGTHDAIIPLPMVLKADRTIRDTLQLARLTCLTLRTGHSADANACPRAELERFLSALVTPGWSYTAPNTRRYFKATDLTNHPFGTATELPNQTTLPFSITVPYRLAPFQWATLAACGQTGKIYSATLRDPAGAPVFSVSKTFGVTSVSDFDFDGVGEPDPECDVIRLDQPGGWGTLTPGTYWWSFTFDGRDINPGNLSYVGDANRPTVATTILDSQQPSTQDAIFDPRGEITMGVDEF